MLEKLGCIRNYFSNYIKIIKFKLRYRKLTKLSIEDIAQSRNWIVAGGNPDIKRTSVYILRDFREGKIGKFILDEFPSVE